MAKTFDGSAFTIQSNKTAIKNETVTMTPATMTESDNGYIIEATLGLQDRLKLRDNQKVATEKNDSYLVMQAFAIDDVFGVDVLAITDGKALLPGAFIPDQNPPDLKKFELDLDDGTLLLSFTDLVSLSSFKHTFINLTNGSTEILQITGGTPKRLSDGSTIVLTLSNDDLDKIVTNPDIGTNTSDTFIKISANYIEDLSQNQAPAVNETAAFKVTVDSKKPTILNFIFNLNDGTLRLTIDETVPGDLFNATYVSIQSVKNLDDEDGKLFNFTDSTVFCDFELLSYTDH